MFHIVANLDQEERWVRQALPPKVAARVARMATHLRALAPEGPVTLWGMPGLADGVPPRVDLQWADPGAKAVNDRRFAQAIAIARGVDLPGACTVGSLAELDRRAPAGAWVAKAPWSSAGRHRIYGAGTVAADQRAAAERLLQLGGELTLEPWMKRISDVAIVGHVGDSVILEAPHRLLTSPRGTFAGIELSDDGLEPRERALLVETAHHVAEALTAAGYRGPFGIDAFVYEQHGRRLAPLCEINARYTFGHVAHAIRRRSGATKLDLGRVD